MLRYGAVLSIVPSGTNMSRRVGRVLFDQSLGDAVEVLSVEEVIFEDDPLGTAVDHIRAVSARNIPHSSEDQSRRHPFFHIELLRDDHPEFGVLNRGPGWYPRPVVGAVSRFVCDHGPLDLRWKVDNEFSDVGHRERRAASQKSDKHLFMHRMNRERSAFSDERTAHVQQDGIDFEPRKHSRMV